MLRGLFVTMVVLLVVGVPLQQASAADLNMGTTKFGEYTVTTNTVGNKLTADITFSATESFVPFITKVKGLASDAGEVNGFMQLHSKFGFEFGGSSFFDLYNTTPTYSRISNSSTANGLALATITSNKIGNLEQLIFHYEVDPASSINVFSSTLGEITIDINAPLTAAAQANLSTISQSYGPNTGGVHTFSEFIPRAVPEPTSLGLLGAGLMFGLVRRRKKE